MWGTLLKLLVLLFLESSVVIGSPHHDGISYTHEESLDKIKTWMRTPLSKQKCIYPLDDEISHDQDNVLIMSVICGHPSSEDNFSWEGKADKHGQFEGEGTLKLGTKGLLVKTGRRQCIRLGKKYKTLFGGKLVELSGTFNHGMLLSGTVTVRVDKGENGMFEAEVTVNRGVLHGVYRISEVGTDKWGVGRINGGDIDLAECWIFGKELIYYGSCADILTPHTTNEAFIILNNFKSVIRGVLTPDGKFIKDALVSRLDLSSENASYCNMKVTGDKIYPYFTYSLESQTKHYTLPYDVSNDEKAICSAMDDRIIPSSINKYFHTLLENFGNFFHLKPHTSPLDKKPIKLISRVYHVEGAIYEGVFTFKRKTHSEFKYTGDLNEDGVFHGFGILELSTKNQCLRGKCNVPEINLISGFFNNGLLEGSVFIVSEENIQISASVAVKGVLHGRLITKGMIPHYPYPEHRESTNFNYIIVKMNGLGFYGYFLNGKPWGSVWYGMVGLEFGNQGLLHGKVDENGKLSGSHISYIYPNHINVLHGVFEDKFMRAAKYRHITELNCNEDGVLEIKVSGKNDGKTEEEVVYFYDPPSNTSLGHPSMLTREDPYEAEVTTIATSGIPNSGSGLYARKNMKKHEVVAWYSGFLFDGEQAKYWDESCRFNSSLSRKANAHCYKYRISTYLGALIDITQEYDDESKFSATLGHKINNGFGKEVNSAFHQCEHPRFGVIVNVLATKAVPAGSELIVNYGYFKGRNNLGNVFDWYFNAEKEYLQRLEGSEN